MSNQSWIGAMMLGSFFVFVTIKGSLQKYVALLLGQSPQPTPVTGVADLSGGTSGQFGGGNWFPLGTGTQTGNGLGGGGGTGGSGGDGTVAPQYGTIAPTQGQ